MNLFLFFKNHKSYEFELFEKKSLRTNLNILTTNDEIFDLT